MTESADEAVHAGQVETVPIGERSTITIRRFPGRVELVELHVYFRPGVNAAGYPPLDVAKMARDADALLGGSVELQRAAEDYIEAAAVVRDESGIDMQLPTFEEALAAVKRSPMMMDSVVERALHGAKHRARRRMRDVDDFRELIDFIDAGHTQAAAAEHFGEEQRTITRWLAQARELGLTYRGMRV